MFPSEAYARFASEVEFDQLPSDVVALCKLILLDSVGVAAAATGVMAASQSIASYARNAYGPGSSALWGFAEGVSPMGAAFANGAFAHALNYDVFGAGYAGLIPPAVLAAANCRDGTSGRDVLTAMAVGIELLTRIQLATAHIPKTYDRVIDGQLQTYFGCAVAAGKALCLSAKEIDNAIGLALMQAAGSMQITLDGDPEAKAFYGAFPNQAGLQSALLAKEGLEAACNALSGRAGFFPLFYATEVSDGLLLDELGERYEMCRARFKRWPTSAAYSGLMAAALEIRTKERIDHAQIERIEIVTDPTMRVWFEPREARCNPANAAAAGNSAPFCIAAVLANGDFTLADLTSRGLAQERVRRLAQRVEARFTQGNREPWQLTLGTSKRLHRTFDATAQFERPWLAHDEVRTKFMTCLRHAAGRVVASRGERIADLIESFEAVQDCSELPRLFTDNPSSY